MESLIIMYHRTLKKTKQKRTNEQLMNILYFSKLLILLLHEENSRHAKLHGL